MYIDSCSLAFRQCNILYLEIFGWLLQPLIRFDLAEIFTRSVFQMDGRFHHKNFEKLDHPTDQSNPSSSDSISLTDHQRSVHLFYSGVC